jgi:hypothetical protein
MTQNLPATITRNDEILAQLDFKPYRNSALRRAIQFIPAPGEAQTQEITCPWGERLTAKAGDYIVSEVSAPQDRWPVERTIFERTYVEVEPGLVVKRQVTHLVPLTDFTGDPDQVVQVHTIEGVVSIRAGDFYLARGIGGEIWPYPKEKADQILERVDE